MNKFFKHVGSIRSLKSKLYTDEKSFINMFGENVIANQSEKYFR